MERNKAQILGHGVDLFSFEEAFVFTEAALGDSKGMQIVTINPEMIETANKNKEFAEILNNADLVIPDGVGIKIALKIKGINQENIPGIEFAKKLIEYAQKNNCPIALLGAKEEIIQKTKNNLLREFSTLNISYTRNGYFKSEDEEEILEEMKAAAPRIAFIALGAPKQEILINKFKQQMKETVFIGVGGSFDVWSGTVERAPEIWQKLGLEWLYRTIKEPARFKRIFPTLPMFVIKVIIESVFQKKGQ